MKTAPPAASSARDLTVVIELTVVAKNKRRFHQRLLAMLDIDDRKTTVGEVHIHSSVAVGKFARLVRTSMLEDLAHP